MSPPPGPPRCAAPTASGRSPWTIALLALGALAALLWLRRPSYLPDVPLSSASADGVSAGPAASPILCTGSSGCLVVYVAPWCGPCRSSLPGDVALADFIEAKGYETVFVVGMDDVHACLEMTKSIGRPARIDSDRKWARAAGISGVPHFLVTTPTGKIVKRQAGAYMAPVEQVAQLLGIS
jgi:thiol-disulfide isomerase/thioredoxin